ncbi:MAG: Lrp/AsnC family transcriptional regulator [Candidatus Lokiarchaeota archaeon]|nr:Lrp/AsnC family transcriptional regulator [Candidatus Lokiarchaeota archaeon]
MDTPKKFKKKLKLDKINIELFKSLDEDGRINYSRIGKKFGLSHVAIKNRYENLIKKNIIKPSLLVNFSKLDFKLAILLLELETESLDKIKDIYSKCPRVLFSFNLIGEYNHLLLFFAENLETIETIFNSCMLYNLKGVRKSNILLFGSLKEDLFLPLNLSQLDQQNENTPCGTCCKFCKSFIKGQCIGCPASKYYEGPLKIT